MTTTNLDFEHIKRTDGRLLIPAPWDQVENLCGRLRLCGVPATAYFDRTGHSAAVQLPEQVDMLAVSRFLNETA